MASVGARTDENASGPFYESMLRSLLADGTLHVDDRVLVVAGGATDRNALRACGFRNAVVSNLASYEENHALEPYDWSRQDAEHLTFDDEEFDFVIVHEGLHHCYSPHAALREMYRVARRGVLVIEPIDNWFTRLGVAMGFGQVYEHAAVCHGNCRSGGVADSNVPNYVYRWTPPEIEKTVKCFAPFGEHRFEFHQRFVLPDLQLEGSQRRPVYWLVRAAGPILRRLSALVPGFGNNFAAVVVKPELPRQLHPWLQWRDGVVEPNQAWLQARYQRGPASEQH